MIPAMLSKNRGRVAGVLLMAAVMAAFPATARADAGIPMLPVSPTTMLFFLLLVIIIEVIYLQARLQPRLGRTIFAVSTVNAATTGLGFPLAWLMYVGLESWAGFPGAQSGQFKDMEFVPLWVCNKMFPEWPGTQREIWAIMAVFITLLVPSYLLTRIIKSWVFDWYDLLRTEGEVKPAILVANRLSYLLLAVTGCMLLYRSFHGM